MCPITKYEISKSNTSLDKYTDLDDPEIIEDGGYKISFSSRYVRNHTFFIIASNDNGFWWASEEITI